jgi:hypothetical protein
MTTTTLHPGTRRRTLLAALSWWAWLPLPGRSQAQAGTTWRVGPGEAITRVA